MEISNSILDSIDIITKHEIYNAKFDKTIEAKIMKCVNKDIGYYRCDYKGTTLYAYSNNLSIIYRKGNLVYILVPQNDMTKDKLILGFAGNDEAINKDSLMPINNSLLVSVNERERDLKFYYIQ